MSRISTVSALICVRDGEAYLAEAIESALSQTVPPDEVIVVDDGSEDGSREVARSYAPRVQLIEQARLGAGAARNRSVAASSADMVAFLDCDDIWEPRKLELQLEAFARDGELEFCFTHVQEFATPIDGERFVVRPAPLAGVLPSSLCARRESIDRASGFDPEARIGDLLGWLLRARERGMREALLPDVLVRRRVHRNNTTRRRRNEFGDYARILKEALDRRRAST